MADPEEFQYTQVDEDFTFENLDDLQSLIDLLSDDLEEVISLGDDISNPEAGLSDWSGVSQRSFRSIWQEGGWTESVSFEDSSGESHSANDVSGALRMSVVALNSLKGDAELSAQNIIDADEAQPFE